MSWINPRLQPGEERRVLTGIPGKTGVVYTLDRETGEFPWATPTITQNVCARMRASTFEDEEASRLYAIAWRSQLAPGTDQVGAVHAILRRDGGDHRGDHLGIRAAGRHHVARGDRRRAGVRGRRQRAVPRLDDRTGEVLWEINLGSSGFPITYAVDGRQYVAVSTGTPRFINLTPELRPSLGNNLFVFALP